MPIDLSGFWDAVLEFGRTKGLEALIALLESLRGKSDAVFGDDAKAADIRAQYENMSAEQQEQVFAGSAE